ncbi:helix-turn-helix domain-containing protein [Streptomyces sp. NPDC048425]|uniref:helix-turn-helix domain-containing protein n=1 Tax=Streptomyces sp. NPDC048425 TaxID=3365548 RepID=UPI003714C5FD
MTRRVEDYAAALGYSPRSLPRATLAATGRTAKQYADDRGLLEAKRLLRHSGLAAKEVAGWLGFTDTSDFTKFFRLRTGVTPGAFGDRLRPQVMLSARQKSTRSRRVARLCPVSCSTRCRR